MKRWILLCSVMPLMVGCVGSLEEKEKEVLEYNKGVVEMYESHDKLKRMSEEKREGVLKEVLKDEGISLELIESRLSEEEKEIFKYGMEARSTYYTGLGSKGLREVVFITGSGGRQMYVELLWGEEGLIGIERKVLSE